MIRLLCFGVFFKSICVKVIFSFYVPGYYSVGAVYGGRDSSVGVATRYGLNGPGMESRLRGDIFRTRPDRPWGPPSLLYNGYRVFPGGKVVGAWC